MCARSCQSSKLSNLLSCSWFLDCPSWSRSFHFLGTTQSPIHNTKASSYYSKQNMAMTKSSAWWSLFVVVVVAFWLPLTVTAQPKRPSDFAEAVRALGQKTDIVTQDGLLKPAIVEGSPAPNDRYPYMASLHVDPTDFQKGHLCGGAVRRCSLCCCVVLS